MVAWMPNGSIFEPKRLHPALEAELRCSVSRAKLLARSSPALDEMVTIVTGPLTAHDGQDGAE